jgi:hypothetical protein
MKEVAKMLKKVSLAMAVLLMFVPLGNAAILLSVDGGANPGTLDLQPSQTITISVTNDNEGLPDFLLYVDALSAPGSFTLSNVTLGPDAGDAGSQIVYVQGPYDVEGGKEILMSQGWAPGSDSRGGTLVLFDLHCESPNNDVTIQLWDDRVGYDAPVDQLVIHQVVPEPMTLALLGLGGLLLRRKTA